MNKQEFAKAMAFLSAAIDRPIGKTTLAAWYEFVKDLPAGAVLAAIHTVIATDEYPTLPSIGKIRTTAIRLSFPKRPLAAEAWGATIKAISRHGHYGEKEALESLPEEAAQTAKLMGWQQMCHAENIEVIRGQFMKMYDSLAARADQEQLIPPEARRLIGDIADRLSLPEGAISDEKARADRPAGDSAGQEPE